MLKERWMILLNLLENRCYNGFSKEFRLIRYLVSTTKGINSPHLRLVEQEGLLISSFQMLLT